MNIAIVILNWNGKKLLEKFLPQIISYSPGAHLYIIDNQSQDDSIKFIENNFPEITMIKNIANEGFAKGYNTGLQFVKEDIFCLLNSDVEVTKNWIEPVISLFKKNENIAAIQPKILSFYQKDTFEFAGAAGGLIDNLGYPYCRGRIFDQIEKDNGQYNDELEILWASGCCFFIRKKDFWEQNGFDERFFAHQEEIDLCWRLINSGKKVYYTGKSTIYHIGGATLNKKNPEKTFLNFRNNLTMLLKNLPYSSLFWIIPLRLCLDGIAGLFFLRKEGISHLFAIIKAHLSFYAQVPRTWKLRKPNQIKKFYGTKWLIFKHFLRYYI